MDDKYKHITVLIFGASGRQTLPVCKGFFLLGCRVVVYCHSKLDTGYLTRYSTEKILFGDVKMGEENFCECGERLIRQGCYDLVVPLGDATAKFLAQRKNELKSFAKIAVNDWPVFLYAIDKLNTMRVCQEYGISAPKTLVTDDPVKCIKAGELKFPVVVKPRTGVGSIGFQIIHSMERLETYLSGYKNENGPLLVQEYVEQGDNPQYRADLFRDRDGIFRLVMVGKVTRWFPLDGGSGIFAYTIHDDLIAENCKKLLDAIHWNGYANIDLVWDKNTNTAKILEINGRTGATIKLDYVAGANISQLILENELGYPVTDMTEYEDNKRVTCLLPDLLWFIKSKRRFHADPSWFDRRGVHDTIFSWDDPLPTIGFLINSIQSYREAMSKRKRI